MAEDKSRDGRMKLGMRVRVLCRGGGKGKKKEMLAKVEQQGMEREG